MLALENHKEWEMADMVEFMEGVASEHIGVALDWIRRHATEAMPDLGDLDQDGRLAIEEINIRRSVAYARERLGLDAAG